MDGLDRQPTKKQVLDLVQILNRTYEYPFQWTSRISKKEHTDQFGQTIDRGEKYWRMRMGGYYSNDLKLSAASMKRFLFLIFAPHPTWEHDAMVTLQNEMQKIRDIMNKLRSGKIEDYP